MLSLRSFLISRWGRVFFFPAEGAKVFVYRLVVIALELDCLQEQIRKKLAARRDRVMVEIRDAGRRQHVFIDEEVPGTLAAVTGQNCMCTHTRESCVPCITNVGGASAET